MKSLVLVLSMLVLGHQAKAIVMPGVDRIIPYYCSYNVESDANIKSICFSARSSGEKFLTIGYVEKGQQQFMQLPIYSIQPGNSGFTGESSSVVVSVLVEGDEMFSFFGLGTVEEIRSLNGEIFGHEFKAHDFDHVFQAM
jgi:hypothetical protein